MNAPQNLGVVPVNAYIRSLEQKADTLDWSGAYPQADTLRREAQSVKKYHLDTGSVFYPMF